MYGAFAQYYDGLTADVDYPLRADYFSSLIKEHSDIPVSLVLDVCCGSGSLTAALSACSYEMIGVDQSAQMLALAGGKLSQLPQMPLLLCQDVSALDLYGMVDAAVSSLDSLNHLPSLEALSRLFLRLSLFLETGGVFVFDLNTLYKHQRVLSGQTFVRESKNLLCVWQNSLCRQGRVDIAIDFFSRQKNGLYHREREEFSELAFTVEEVMAAAQPHFTLEAVYGDCKHSPPTDSEERMTLVLKNHRAHEGAV